MHKKELSITYTEYNSAEELPIADRTLLEAARGAAKDAYAPYSKFQVGAAVLLQNDEVITGNNQENADFTDGLCAERVALFYAHARYPNEPVVALAVTASNPNGRVKDPARPCGSCRQVMVETETRFKTPIRIILDGSNAIHIVENAEQLLPLAFKPSALR